MAFTYPSDYFKSLGEDEKPPIVWPKADKPLEILRAVIYEGLKSGGGLSVDVINCYLAAVAETVTDQLCQDWISFGRVIGRKECKISIKDLFSAKDSEPIKVTGLEDPSLDNGYDPWLVFIIMVIWRLNRSSLHGKALQNFKERARKLLKLHFGKFCNLIDVGAVSKKYKNLGSNIVTSKLVAAYDMFLFKFSTQYSFKIIRFGSGVTRAKDCDLLLAISKLSHRVNLKRTHMFDWIFTETLKDDAERIMPPGQEMGDCYGYFWYLADMLNIKSVYTRAMNPRMSLFINIIGTINDFSSSEYNFNWSQQKMPTDLPINEILRNAEFVAYGTRSLLIKCFHRSQEALIEYAKSVESRIERDNTGPENHNPTDYFLWLEKNDFQPKCIHEYLLKQSEQFADTKKGTVGDFMKNHYAGDQKVDLTNVKWTKVFNIV